MSLEISVEKHLGPIFDNPTEDIQQIFQASSFLVLREYTEEAPVNIGDLVRGIKSIKEGALQYRVTTTTTANGFAYPEAVHEGTGIFEGGADRGKGNWTRVGGYSEEDLIIFKSIKKRGGEISMRPNKFAKRAKEVSEPKVVNFVREKLLNGLQ